MCLVGTGWYGREVVDYIKYNQRRMVRILHIRLGSLQIRHQNGMEEGYYSIHYDGKYYFTSTFDHQNRKLQDDILIELSNDIIPQHIMLERWENCMMLFQFELQIGELKGRSFAKKTLQTKWQQFLSIQFQIYEQRDIIFADKFIDNVSQHYLIIEDLFFSAEQHNTRATKQPNYFSIQTKNGNYVLPLRGAVVLIKLPDSLQISSFINNTFNGKSSIITHKQLSNGQEISLDKDTKQAGKVKLKIRWAINLHRYQVDQNLLLQSNQLMLYDFQFKFDNPGDVVGSKFKITHGSKAFDFSQDIDKAKVTKVKKVVFFVIKSQTEDVNFVLQRGGKLLTYCRFNSSELKANSLTTIKRKWPDLMNPTKFYGFIKVRGERAKNLSVPQSNKYWREVLRRKHSLTNMMISVHQPSAYFPSKQSLTIVAKIENQEKAIQNIMNINFYQDQDEPTRSVAQFAVKGQESLYLIIKTDVKSNDFAGIGVVNTTELKLGSNVCEVPFFKNQEKAGVLNCLINKMVFWPFLKPLFQNQTPLQAQQSLGVDLFFNNIVFTPYFYTYRYDNKEQVYCIVQVSKVKKVLILENTQHDKLSFFAAAGSDALNYSVSQPDIIKIRISFLISDLGHQEEIYGTATCKIKGSDIYKETLRLKNIDIVNDYSVVLGTFSLQASKGMSPKPSPKIKTADNQKPSIRSFDMSQASFQSNLMPRKSSHLSRRYSGGYSSNSSKPVVHNFMKKNTQPGKPYPEVKLPVIKERKNKDSFTDLMHMMKVRKRGIGGAYDDKGLSSPKYQKSPKQQRHSFDLRRLQQSNPNINRNLQILFPRKGNQKFIQQTRTKQNDYEQRLRGLKSVMNEISDSGEVEPSIRESHHQTPYQNQQFYEPEPQWEGNQFAQ